VSLRAAALLVVVHGGGQHRAHRVRHLEECQNDRRVNESGRLQHGAQIVLQLVLALLDELDGQ